MAPNPPPPPPGLKDTIANSTATWHDNLQSLFDYAKDRFADIIWELNSDSGKWIEEVWGHKGLSSFSRFSLPRLLSSLVI